MRKVSDRAGPDTRSSSDSQDSGSGSGDEKFAHIKNANKKIRLLDILRHYGFKIEKNYQRPSWGNNITCPLPTHKGAKERTPSFGYNFVSDHCHCFGCNFTGRAVEFIAAYEGVTRSSVAERILSQYGEDVSTDLKDFGEDYEDNLSPILLDGSKFLQDQIREHKHDAKKLQEIEKLIWWLDFYMMKMPSNQITADDLKYRFNRVKELLDDEA